MTSGGYTAAEAAKLQTFSDRKECRSAKNYKAKQPPKCKPVCDACLQKWLAAIDKEGAPDNGARHFALKAL